MENNTGLSEGEKFFVSNYLRHLYSTKETGDITVDEIIERDLAYMDSLIREVQQEIVDATLPEFLRPIPRETKKV